MNHNALVFPLEQIKKKSNNKNHISRFSFEKLYKVVKKKIFTCLHTNLIYIVTNDISSTFVISKRNTI